MQVGNTGDDEEWKVLYEKENDPDAQVLEVPNLNPFTHYRSANTPHRQQSIGDLFISISSCYCCFSLLNFVCVLFTNGVSHKYSTPNLPSRSVH